MHLNPNQPTDAAGLAAFRALFGAVLFFSTIRFGAMGWIESIYLAPEFHFTYPGFEWAVVPRAPLVYAVFSGMLAASAGLALGLYPRVSAGVFFVLFTYVELWERATYLNHYYFVSLVALLLVSTPTAGAFSVRPNPDQITVRRLHYTALRAFVSIVYFYAGFAKLNQDWLELGQPLLTWLKPHQAVFTLGGALPLEFVAIAMSWGGALFDLTVWLFLLWPKTRRWAFLVAIVFHTTVGLLFPIGVFPVVMVVAITIFFSPSWPRKFMTIRPSIRQPPFAPTRVGNLLVAAFLATQILLPLRSYLYPGFVNWNDDGFKWSWRVMLVERVGAVEFDVVTSTTTQRIHPRHVLTPQQFKMLTVTPDMILEYAHHLGQQYAHEGDVKVFAHSSLAFNGRRSRAWIDPERDLVQVSRFGSHDFVLPWP